MGLERWLRAHWLLFQRSWIRFPAPIWQPTTICNSICNSSPRWSNTLFWPVWALQACGAQTEMHANAYTQKISNLKNNNKTKWNLFLNNSLGYILFSHPLKTKANLHAKVMYNIFGFLQKGLNLPWIFAIQDVMSSDLYFLFCFYSKDKVSLCISGWPGIYYVDRAGLKLSQWALPVSVCLCLLSAAIKAVYHHTQTSSAFWRIDQYFDNHTHQEHHLT